MAHCTKKKKTERGKEKRALGDIESPESTSQKSAPLAQG